MDQKIKQTGIDIGGNIRRVQSRGEPLTSFAVSLAMKRMSLIFAM